MNFLTRTYFAPENFSLISTRNSWPISFKINYLYILKYAYFLKRKGTDSGAGVPVLEYRPEIELTFIF